MFSLTNWVLSCLGWDYNQNVPDKVPELEIPKIDDINDEAMERALHARRTIVKSNMILLTPEMIEKSRLVCLSPKK